MKKIIFFVLTLVCISTISQAQIEKPIGGGNQTITIKPFKASAEDAAKIKNILAGMSKSAYSIQVKQNNKAVAYGSLNKARVSSGVAVTSSLGNAAGGWVQDILASIIKSTRTIDRDAVAQLQAIASKYQ